MGEGPLGSVNLDLDSSELNLAALDLIRRGDTVALRHLYRDARTRARSLIDFGDVESGLAELLDKISCLAATFIDYEQPRWLEETIATLGEIYAMPLREGDVQRFGYSTRISREEVAPRVWLAILERVFAIGGLAVRRENWAAVRALTLQLPRPWAEDGYEANWLRHGLTMASRAEQFQRGEQDVSLLSLTRETAARLPCLRPAGVGSEDDELLTSLAQFDVLANLVAISAAGSLEGRVFYPNFARFRQHRVQPIVNRLLADSDMRNALVDLTIGTWPVPWKRSESARSPKACATPVSTAGVARPSRISSSHIFGRLPTRDRDLAPRRSA